MADHFTDFAASHDEVGNVFLGRVWIDRKVRWVGPAFQHAGVSIHILLSFLRQGLLVDIGTFGDANLEPLLVHAEWQWLKDIGPWNHWRGLVLHLGSDHRAFFSRHFFQCGFAWRLFLGASIDTFVECRFSRGRLSNRKIIRSFSGIVNAQLEDLSLWESILVWEEFVQELVRLFFHFKRIKILLYLWKKSLINVVFFATQIINSRLNYQHKIAKFNTGLLN